MALTLLLAGAVLLGGCLGGSKSDDGTDGGGTSGTQPTGNGQTPICPHEAATDCPPPPTGPTSLELVNCTRHGFYYLADHEKVSALLPPGYSPDADLPVLQLATVAYFCESAIFDNQTVIQDYRMFRTGLSARVPDEVSRDDTNAYWLEIYVNNETAASRWQHEGFPAVVADISRTEAPGGVDYQLSQDGTAIYEVQIRGRTDPQPSAVFVPAFRGHHASNGTSYWFDSQGDENQSGGYEGGTFIAHGGAAAAIALTPMGPIVVDSIAAQAHALLVFNQPLPEDQ